MPDDNQQDSGEQLFDTDIPDTDADSESTSEEQTSDSETEEIEEGLDLKDEGKSLSKTEQERLKQENVWYARISTGEVDIDDLPANLKWLKPRLLARLDAQKKEPDIEAIVEKKLAEKQEAQKFASLKDTLQESRLTKLERQELESEYKDLRANGLSPSKALQKAMKIVGVQGQGEVSTERLRRDMQVPHPGLKLRVDKDPLADPEAFQRLDQQSRLTKLEQIRRNNPKLVLPPPAGVPIPR